MNRHDEIKRLLRASKEMQNKEELTEETRRLLVDRGIIIEQAREMVIRPEGEDQELMDYEQEEPSVEDKQKQYRISGGLITLHGKDKKDLELTTAEKESFQETMDEFVEEVSDLAEFATLNVFPNNVDWSGKIIDFEIEFYYTISEDNGVYINGDMIKLDASLLELINKLTSYYNKFKAKWARVISQRKKTMREDGDQT